MHISYVELEGDPTQNLDALHTMINVMHDAGMGYFSFNAKMDCDPACGYVGILDSTCPNCGRRETEDAPFIRPRRITGSLRALHTARCVEQESELLGHLNG